MDDETKKLFDEQMKKLNEINESVEKTRKYFLWTLIASVVFFILPLIGLVFVIPFFLRTITSGLL